MATKSLVSALFLLFSSRPAYADDLIRGRGSYQLEIDVARFYGDSVQTYIELYYGIRENIMTYRPDSGHFSSSTYLKWTIRTDSSKVAEKDWVVPHTIDDTSAISRSQTLVGIQSVGLPPGRYSMSLTSYDSNDPSRRDSFSTPLIVSRFPEDHEALSDVEFCSSIKPSSNKESIFYKNTLEVTPNAGKLYGSGLPIMYYYVEAYNLISSHSTHPGVIIRTTVLDAYGKEILSKDKTKPRQHNSTVEIGTLNLSALHGGTYLFKVSMLDTAQTVLATVSKKFFVYKPGAPTDTSQNPFMGEGATSEISVMTEPEVYKAFAQAKYIATEAERSQFEKLPDLRSKQNFLYEFWRNRNPNPAGSGNEFKENYSRRIDYTNKNFGVGSREGWKTDRGRVYVTYGACDEVERFPSTAESLPYEIWHFNSLQGGVIFVFVDRTSLGDYILVHSTHRDELRDDNWYEEWAHKTR